MVRRLVLIAALLTCVTAYAIENIVWIDFTQPIELTGGTWRNVPAVSASWIDPDYATLNALWYLDGPVRTSTIPTEEPSVTNVLQCSSVSTELRDWGAYGSYRTWTTVNAVFFDPSSIGNAMDGKSNVSVSCWVQRLNSSYSDGIFSFDYANREWEMRYNIVGDGTIYSDLNVGVNEWNFNVSSWWSATTDTGKWVFIKIGRAHV